MERWGPETFPELRPPHNHSYYLSDTPRRIPTGPQAVSPGRQPSKHRDSTLRSSPRPPRSFAFRSFQLLRSSRSPDAGDLLTWGQRSAGAYGALARPPTPLTQAFYYLPRSQEVRWVRTVSYFERRGATSKWLSPQYIVIIVLFHYWLSILHLIHELNCVTGMYM